MRSIKKEEQNLMTYVSKADERSNRAVMDAPKVHYCYHHYMTFLCSYSQRAVEEGSFTDQKIFMVALFGLS